MHSSSNHEVRSGHSGNFSNHLTTEKLKDHRSNDITELHSKTNTYSSNEFNVHRVYDTWVAILQEPNNPKSPIGTQDYIDGYKELLKFFDQLGYIFKFVKDDVVDKLGILQTFVDKDKKRTILHFDTIQKAIEYETEHNLIKTNPINFTRTLLRLHRALLFIIEFLRCLVDRPLSENTTIIATQCYDATLYNYHGFFIRQSVKVGFRMLPSRRQLDEIIFHGHKTELFEQYKTFIKIIQQIYDIIQTFYEEKKYLQLP